MCDRIAVMYLGKIVELAEADQLFDHPRHPYTGALLSAVPVPDPRMAREKQRQVLGGDVPSPDQPAARRAASTRAARRRATAICNVDEPLLEVKEGGNIAACHFPLTDEEIAKRVPTAASERLRCFVDAEECPARARGAAVDARGDAHRLRVGASLQVARASASATDAAASFIAVQGAIRVDEARFDGERWPTPPSSPRATTGFAIGAVPPYGVTSRRDRDRRRRGPARPIATLWARRRDAVVGLRPSRRPSSWRAPPDGVARVRSR